MQQGLTKEDAYLDVFNRVRGLYNAAITIGEEMDMLPAPELTDLKEPQELETGIREELRRYISGSGRGFLHDENYYFRVSWLRGGLRQYLERERIIEKVGRRRDLTEKGITIPQHLIRSGSGNAIFYVVSAETLGISD